MFTHRLFGLGVALVALTLTLPVQAGFSKKKKKITGVPLGGAKADKAAMKKADAASMPYAPIEVSIPPADLAKLKMQEEFEGLSDAEILAKVIAMRRAVLCAIELIKKDNRQIGDGLERLYRSGSICLGFNPKGRRVGAEIKNDGKKKFNTEPINLYKIYCANLPPYHPSLFEMVNDLSHEGLHAVQDVLLKKQGTKLQIALSKQCAEIEASAGELTRTCEMLRILDAMEMSGMIPSDAKGFYKEMANDLESAFKGDASGRQMAIDTFQKRCKVIKGKAKEVKEFRELYKKAAELAIEGSPDAAAIGAGLKKHRLFQYFGRTGEFKAITKFYFNKAGKIELGKYLKDDSMRQLLPPDFEETSFQVMGVDGICDALVLEDQNLILIGGVDDADSPEDMDEGVIVAVDIDSVTGAMLGETQRECYRGEMLGAGFALARNEFESTDPFYAMTRDTGTICHFEDTNDDDCPDSAHVVGGFAIPSGGDLIDFRFTEQHQVIGLEFDEDTVLSSDDQFFVASRGVPGGDFLPQPRENDLDDITMRPSLDGIPYVGLDCIKLAGTPGSRFELFYSDPQEKVAEGCLSPNGAAFADLSLPIPTDRELFIEDLDTGLVSETFICAPLPPDQPIIVGQPGGITGGFQFRLTHEPDRTVGWREGEDLGNLPEVGWDSTNAWGQAYRDVDHTRKGAPDQSFLLGEVHTTATLGGVADELTVAPGLPTTLDVSLNDGAEPGVKFVLEDDPGLHPDRFKFNADGTFTVSLLTFGGQISFTYRQFRDGISGPVTTVLVGTDTSILTDPPVLDGPGGVPWVEAIVLELAPPPLLELNYPLYQFVLGNNPADLCVDPHWHAFAPVSPIEDPLLDVPDPDGPNCGFGLLIDNPPKGYMMPLADWTQFRFVNP